MDGTLLDDRKLVTEEVMAELRKLVDRDICVTLASGRFPASVWLHARHIGLNAPLVALNGAVLLDPEKGEEVETTPIPGELAKKIAEFARDEGVYVHYYGYNVLIVEEINEMNGKWAIGNVVVDESRELLMDNYGDQLMYFSLEEVGDLTEYFNTDRVPVYKATIIDNDPELVERLFRKMESWPEVTITRTGKRRFDINASGVSKKQALIKICELRDIDSKETVAVGDFDNDVEMVAWAGLGVAMENGNERIKKVADRVTASNNHHGVAEVAKRYF